MSDGNLETPPDPNVTIDGETFTIDEQYCMAILWLAAQFNYPYAFNRESDHDKRMHAAAESLVSRGLVAKDEVEDRRFLRRTGLSPDGSPIFVYDHPYILKAGISDAIADQIQTLGKFSIHDLIPKP